MLVTTHTQQTSRRQPQPPPECPLCNDMKFIIPITNGASERAVPCRCYEDVLAAQQEQLLVENGRLPPSLQTMTLQTFIATNRQQAIAQARCREFAHDPQGWLLLVGKSGNGKIHLAAAVANVRLGQQQPVHFSNSADLLDKIRSTYDSHNSHSYDETFHTICNDPLLILTDLGHENRTPWAQEKLYQLLNHRAQHQLPMVMTTAYEVTRLDGRIASHILHHPDCQVYPL